MAADVTEELRQFHRFVADKLSGGAAEMSPEEALDEWRRLHPQDHVAAEDVAALREALDDMAKGDQGMPFEQFDANFRERHNISKQP